jgi:hypothetical protein
MTKGKRIAIIIGSGVAIGYVAYRLIINNKIKAANNNATPEVQKELLIQDILILKKLPDTEENRRPYRNMTVEQINAEILSYSEPPTALNSNLTQEELDIIKVYQEEGLSAAIDYLSEEEISQFLYGY